MKSSRVATALENNLDELRRRQELESLRVFVENEQCFMPSADPKTASITMEELKKLARVWKLHGKPIYPISFHCPCIYNTSNPFKITFPLSSQQHVHHLT